MRTTLLLLVVFMLAGCGAAAVGTEDDVTGSQLAATSASEPATEVSQPTTTPMAATETIQPTVTTEKATEVSQPEATTSSSLSSGEVLAVWTRSGGFAGFHDVLTVFADGRLSLEQKGASTSGQAAPADIERLQQILEGPEWQQLDQQYGVQHPDAFHYSIHANGKTVETFDGSDNPKILADLLGQFQELYHKVVPAPGEGSIE